VGEYGLAFELSRIVGDGPSMMGLRWSRNGRRCGLPVKPPTWGAAPALREIGVDVVLSESSGEPLTSAEALYPYYNEEKARRRSKMGFFGMRGIVTRLTLPAARTAAGTVR
jgi:hypothetical protein